jgi:hypothetical protein
MRFGNQIFALGVALSFFLSPLASADTPDVTNEYPELKKFLFKEPKSDFQVGFGFNPVGIMNNRIFVAVNVFELHWDNDFWDIEILNAQVGFGFSKDSFSGSKHFSVRFSPRIKILKYVSVGPIVGYEYVSFPDVNARLRKDTRISPFEPFSSRGLLYGVGFSETVSLQEDYSITLHQSVYNQTYSTTKSPDGWDYEYERTEIQTDPDKTAVKPSLVFLFGVSLLF